MSFKVTADVRSTIERLASKLSLDVGVRYTLTDVIEEAIILLARRERIEESKKPTRKKGAGC